MFAKFNTIVVIAGTMIVSYITILGAFNTAREGEAMGKKFNLWLPIRAMSGMMLMVPTPGTGYSIIQITVMWVILQGIGAANVMWGVILDYLDTGQNIGITQSTILNNQINAFKPQSPPAPTGTLDNLITELFYSAVCTETLKAFTNYSNHADDNIRALFSNVSGINPMQMISTAPITSTEPAPCGPGMNLCSKASQDFKLQFDIPRTKTNATPLCGGFNIIMSFPANNTQYAFNQASLQAGLAITTHAFQSALSVLTPAANLIAERAIAIKANDDGNPNNDLFIVPPLPDPNTLANAKAAYIAQMLALTSGIELPKGANPQPWEKNPLPTQDNNATIANMRASGWVTAGSYYSTLISNSNSIITTIESVFQPPIVTSSAFSNNTLNATQTDALAADQKLKDKLTFALQLATQQQGPSQITAAPVTIPGIPNIGGGGGITAALSGIGIEVTGKFAEYFDKWTDVFNAGVNQVNAQSTAWQTAGTTALQINSNVPGDIITFLGQLGYDLMKPAETLIFGLFGGAIAGVAMAAIPSITVGGSFITLMQTLIMVFAPFVAALWTLGATLNIYVPMIPYMMFTVAAFGWLIGAAEAIVAAPLIALGLVQPGGEELGGATTGLKLLGQLFLRPTLMLFGFVMSITLLQAMVRLVSYGFFQAVKSQVHDTFLSFLPVLAIYVFFLIAVINKAFSLVAHLPDQIFRWLGMSAERTDMSMAEKAEGWSDKGSGAANKAMTGTAAGAGTKLGEGREAHDKKTPWFK
jgi:conjugal transfer/type IV secretion protein DotA/TraY